MMHHTLPFLFGIIVLIVFVVVFARRIKIAYPILLVLAGLGLSFVPALPKLKLDPDWIFFIFLPPLLFDASWEISYKQLKKMWRVVGSFSFLVVFFTATSVAVFSNHFIPGFSLALGFLLGGIVSPPDAVSASAILRFVHIPKSSKTLLEGESLFNDASSLIIFRFAMIAVATGQFIWGEALLSFGWMAIGGAFLGLAMGWMVEKTVTRLPKDGPIITTLMLVAPYLFYWIAEEVHSSGVMAVVCGGLYLANKRLSFMSSEGRLNNTNFWQSFVFILNGIVFFIIGFDFPEIIGGLRDAGISIQDGLVYGTMVTVLIILVRIVSCYGAVLSTWVFRRNVIASDFKFKDYWYFPLILGWTGMRGVVSLASALSIPVYLDTSGVLFPNRALILFISFVVIILTLFLQGLTLPGILRRSPIPDMMPNEADEQHELRMLRRDIWTYSLDYVQDKYRQHIAQDEQLANLLLKWQRKMESNEAIIQVPKHKEVYLDILNAQRQFLVDKNKDPSFDEELIRRQILLIDLEEERTKIA